MQRVRLHQQALKLDAIQELPQGLAVTDQGVNRVTVADLCVHPGLEQALKAFHVELSQEQAKARVRWWLANMGAEERVEGLAMALLLRRSLLLGYTLHPKQ
jgi:hypothetical protein